MPSNPVRILWVLPAVFALHELEEWNILAWYQSAWTNVGADQMTPVIVRTWLVFATLLGLVWTYLGTRLRNPRVSAHVVLFFFLFLPFGHTVPHLYWLVDLRAYHHGVVTAVLLIVPLTLYVATRLVTEKLVSWWYLAVVFLLSVPQSVGAIRLGYQIPDEGLPHYQLSSWLVSLVT